MVKMKKKYKLDLPKGKPLKVKTKKFKNRKVKRIL